MVSPDQNPLSDFAVFPVFFRVKLTAALGVGNHFFKGDDGGCQPVYVRHLGAGPGRVEHNIVRFQFLDARRIAKLY
jgi:hypothetical protein